jgi:tetratricopeptide (TPR) repeat protein
MTSDDDKILQDYIERLLVLQDEHEDWLDEQELEDVARDLGLSDEDLAGLEERIDADWQRGRHFYENGAWDDAVRELRRAAVLDPFNVPLLQELAAAHVSRWQETRRDEDRNAAERYARRCIELDPNHEPSFGLLATLSPLATGKRKPARSKAWVFMVAAGAVAMLGLLIVGPSSFSPTDGEAPAPPSEVSPTAVDAEPSGQHEIPIELGDGIEATGLLVDVRQSLLSIYDSAFAYELKATVSSESEEVHRLRLRASMVLPNQEEILTGFVDARDDYQPYLRPGERVPLSRTFYEEGSAPNLDHVRLSIDIAELEPAASAYDAPIPLELDWPFDQPAHIDIDVGERDGRIAETGTERAHFLTLTTHNRGVRSLHRLVLEVTWLDAEDEPIATARVFVVPPGGPSLRSGETWIAHAVGEFPMGEDPPFARYTVSVVAAE